ncbi:hypothetical protein LEN26_010581 [Aphanomyces euteiches]|nr:hypothetical protein AeMF1_009620 [Aphanomyces euteiches]KAH9121599.1 hypothetical protein LEN26_010581 [Aphanomyces euteiches]KAH9193707.1 hypothetical protein AeNC1_004321 [Aphanomyces euteiches]
MTLPNRPNYIIRPSSKFMETHASRLTHDYVSLVEKHPLTPLIQRAMTALATPQASQYFGGTFVFPTKKELAKLIAQSQAPGVATITPTLLVVAMLYMKLLRYVQDLSRRICESIGESSSTGSPMSMKSEDSGDDDDDESTKKSKRARLARQSNELMTAWFLAHKTNPYPTAKERAEIAAATHLSELQVRNWFANMRKRHWKPQHVEKKPRCLLDLVLRRSSSDT